MSYENKWEDRHIWLEILVLRDIYKTCWTEEVNRMGRSTIYLYVLDTGMQFLN